MRLRLPLKKSNELRRYAIRDDFYPLVAVRFTFVACLFQDFGES